MAFGLHRDYASTRNGLGEAVNIAHNGILSSYACLGQVNVNGVSGLGLPDGMLCGYVASVCSKKWNGHMCFFSCWMFATSRFLFDVRATRVGCTSSWSLLGVHLGVVLNPVVVNFCCLRASHSHVCSCRQRLD